MREREREKVRKKKEKERSRKPTHFRKRIRRDVNLLFLSTRLLCLIAYDCTMVKSVLIDNALPEFLF